jgi:pyruvate dehydrogenase E2 component (dihydrolipoamide acetyltransferase)
MDGDNLVENPESNIGLAVGMDDGLRVPVLVGAERLSLRQLAEQARRVTDAARQGTVDAMGRGVFTITNLGMHGVEEFAAIINPPEAAILAVGAIREAVLVKDGAMRAGRVMTMTLSADHRIIDGLCAARFMGRLKEILESPEQLRS